MMKHFLWCFGESQGVTIAFFDCIGRCVGTAPPTPRFAASTCGWRTLALGGFHRSGWPLRFGLPPSASEIPLGGLAFGPIASAFRHAPLRSGRWASWFFRLPLRKLPSASWSSGSPLPLFGMRRFGVVAGRIGSSAFRFGDCPRWVGFSAERVGLLVHRFRFSACADPHRRTAEARTDGAQRHDTCFTSKHLSQHVNLPHRTP